jgi:6-phosphogluconolactonase (cycloisomerase 2 family)
LEGDANVVHAETIAENGSMTEISGSPFTTGNHPAAAAVDFSGEFLYVVNQNDNNISGYAIEQTTGTLTPLSTTTFATGKGPASIVVTRVLK